jgi:hypothetical protein
LRPDGRFDEGTWLSEGEHYGTRANEPRAEPSARDVLFHRAVIHRAVTSAD